MLQQNKISTNYLKTNISNFTLRKRLKARRKYHRKPYPTKGFEIRPRRHKFFAKFERLSVKPIFLDSRGSLSSPGEHPQNVENNIDNFSSSLLPINNKDIINLMERKKPIRKRPAKRQVKNRDLDKKRQRQKVQKTSGLNSRLRQLRRRISRQVFQPIPRRHPRNGGFLLFESRLKILDFRFRLG